MLNHDTTSQLYMLMGLSQLGNNSGENTYFKILLTLLIAFSPLLYKAFEWIYDILEDWIYVEDKENIVSIKFPVHEVKVNKDTYGRDNSSTRQLYSINYLAVNDYIKDNLDKIDGISNLIEILNVCMDYYSSDTDEKNFFLIPADSSEIMIDGDSKIYCKIKSTEKNTEQNRERDDKKDKSGDKNSNDKIKTYELQLFIKLESDTNEGKKSAMIALNKFIASCVEKYNDKNEEKHEGKHWIYEYSHSVKDEYSGPELIFKEYLFENNKDLETNIFFEGKDKLIRYVDKFKYEENLVENKIPNKYEEEYKKIGYTYKATFLFYGFPGCGKTSTIKAILNRTKRHGIIINWNKIKTCEELEALFRNRTINHKDYDARELCYIIEDCDASKNNILLSRKKVNSNELINIDVDGDAEEDDDFENLDDVKIIKEFEPSDEIVNAIQSELATEQQNESENEFEDKNNISNKNKSDTNTSQLIKKILKKMTNTQSLNSMGYVTSKYKFV